LRGHSASGLLLGQYERRPARVTFASLLTALLRASTGFIGRLPAGGSCRRRYRESPLALAASPFVNLTPGESSARHFCV
jgi:hypothetical protein